MYLVYTLKGIILVSRYYITCLNLLFWTIEGRSIFRRLMSDLRIDTGLWPTLNQSGASLPTADRSRLVIKSVSPGLRTGKDGLAER